MTYSGESEPGSSGLCVFTDEGQSELIGAPGDVIIWTETGPDFFSQSAITGVLSGELNDLSDVNSPIALSGQSLVFDGNFWAPANIGGGIPFSPNCFNAYDSTGGEEMEDDTVILDVIRVESIGDYMLDAGEVTVLNDGLYNITYDASFDTKSNKPTEISSWLELNENEVAGTRRWQYVRKNDRCSMSATLILQLSANDVLRIRGDRIGNGAEVKTEADGSSITIERKSL